MRLFVAAMARVALCLLGKRGVTLRLASSRCLCRLLAFVLRTAYWKVHMPVTPFLRTLRQGCPECVRWPDGNPRTSMDAVHTSWHAPVSTCPALPPPVALAGPRRRRDVLDDPLWVARTVVVLRDIAVVLPYDVSLRGTCRVWDAALALRCSQWGGPRCLSKAGTGHACHVPCSLPAAGTVRTSVAARAGEGVVARLTPTRPDPLACGQQPLVLTTMPAGETQRWRAKIIHTPPHPSCRRPPSHGALRCAGLLRASVAHTSPCSLHSFAQWLNSLWCS